ncbi:hypothetical protein CPB85DRAFT_1448447 [Mucidula mucida]|nr:hypothetical protein CPB85DRAFT_1448447 [Mucidula mucida]
MINTYPASQSEAVVDLNEEINEEAGTAMQVDSVAADSAAPTSEPIGEGAPKLVSVAAHSAAPVSELGSPQLDSVAADSAAPNAELPIEDIAESSSSAVPSSSETNSSADTTQVEPPNLLDSAYAQISPLPAETTIDYALCLLTASARTSTEGFSIRQMFLRTTSNGSRELWVQGARVQDVLILTGTMSAFHELRIEQVAADLWQHMRSSASESFAQRIRHRQHDQQSLAHAAGMFLMHEEVNNTTVRGTRAGSHRRSRRGGEGNAGEGSVTGDRLANTLEDRLQADQIPPLTQRLREAPPRQPARTSLMNQLSRSAFQEASGAGSSRTTLRDRMRTLQERIEDSPEDAKGAKDDHMDSTD